MSLPQSLPSRAWVSRIAGWHFKSGRGYMGWGVSGVALMVISGLGRMAEGFITQAQGIQ